MLLVKLVVVCPAGTTMLTVPPATLRPSWCLLALPALVTVTPWPMFSVPLVTAMPLPPLFCTVT